MANVYSPGLQFQAGQIASIPDQDASLPNKTVPIPLVAYLTAGGATPAAGTSADPVFTQSQPSNAATSAITPVTAVAATSLLAKPAAGNFYGGSLTNAATAGFLIAYNSATVPAAAAALTAALVLAVVPVAANGFASIGGTPVPDRFSAGIVLLFSTSTTTYAVPTNAALHIRASVL